MGSANSAEILEPTVASTTPSAYNVRKHAFVAYLHIMNKPGHPQVGTAEHRAILLFRNYYPGARKNKQNSKFNVARMATIRRFKMEYGSKVLPAPVWKALLRGIDKMAKALVDDSVSDAAHYDYLISDKILLDAVERLLVLPESHTPTVRATS